MIKTKILWALFIVSALFCCSFDTSVSAKSNHNTYLSNRVSNFAKIRNNYHCPGITATTRDFAGLRTANGRYKIKQYMLFRSANLHNLNKYGANELHRLGIKHDIDLRAMNGPNGCIRKYPQPGEFHLMKNQYNIKIQYSNYPVESSYQEAHTLKARKRLGEQYRFNYWYTLNPVAREAYHNSIIELIKNGKYKRNATVINCTKGRDRTGALSAIIEYILGMNRSTINDSFLLTNYYQYQSPYTNQMIRLNRFYRNIDSRYHSMYRYIIKGLHISRKNIRSMRREYLQRI